jgi:dihydroorotate dehydrogenase electron transfer subunit
MKYRVIENIRISDGIYSMIFEAPEIAKAAAPGQFVNVKVPFDDSKILRRPISICDIKDDTVIIAYQVKGTGTAHISELKTGDHIDVIGPLGKGFPVFKDKKAALVGGGIGIFPLLYLKKILIKDSSSDCYLGFRNSGCVILDDEFRCGNGSLCISTDNGTAYSPGYITSYFREHAEEYDIVYACGPVEMLKAVKNICESSNILLYMSLEQRMGCGIGACLVCACKVRSGSGSEFDYKHVCKDGPVFESSEVIL